MRILVLSAQPIDSGCALRARYLADSLSKCGNEIIFIKPIHSKPCNLDILLSFFIYFIKIIFKKVDFAIGIKPYPNVTLPLLFKKLFGCKIGIDIDDIDYGYRTGLIPKLSKFAQLLFPRFFDVVTYHNDNLYNYIIKNFKVSSERLYKLEQGVNFDVFQYKPARIKKKVLIYTAHLNIASDLDAILDAYAKVLKIDPKIKLIIAGGGPMERYFIDYSKKIGVYKNIIWTGHISNTDVVKYLSGANIALVYYKDKEVNYYRISMKLREYLAMKKKVVCNDVGDLKKFKRFTYQSDSNLENYARKIINTMADGDKRELDGFKFVLKNYNWDKIGEKFFKYLCKIVF